MNATLVKECLDVLSGKAFYSSYWDCFEVVEANTDSLREQAYKLRYEVFCLENNYNFAADHYEQIERDAYDDQAIHFLLIHKETYKMVGTVRYILPDLNAEIFQFPLQEMCDHPMLHDMDVDMKIGEISRLCMAAEFRKRPEDGQLLPGYNHQDYFTSGEGDDTHNVRRRIPYAPLGLLHKIFEASLFNGRLDCVANFHESDFESFKSLGMSYRILGPRLREYGGTIPVVFNIKNLLDKMVLENPSCWEVISDKGRLHKMANDIATHLWHDSVFDDGISDMIMKRI